VDNALYVLDSFAVLALLGGESSGEEVKALLQKAKTEDVHVMMTWVNLGEVVYIVQRRWGKERVYQVIGTLEATKLEIVSVGRALALMAAEIKAEHSLAYADAYAAGLAKSRGGILVTGDPEFEDLAGEVPIKWLPHRSLP
jgi:ribonuclease VapC